MKTPVPLDATTGPPGAGSRRAPGSFGRVDRLMQRAESLAGAWAARARTTTTAGQERAILRLFGVHGIGGIVGAILTGVFAREAIGGTAGLLEGNPIQVWIQIQGIIATIVYCAVVSFIILKAIDLAIGLRVEEEAEIGGLDLALHGETVK